MTNVENIEDLLEVVLGKHNHEFVLKNVDVTLLHSFDRQISKDVALTDRQHDLLYKKLEIYKNQFIKNNIRNWRGALQNTRSPLREIDRSKYITVVEKDNIVGHDRSYNNLKEGNYIKIRFPFNKKHISKLESCFVKTKRTEYFHQKNSHEHYFYFKPRVCYDLVKKFPTWNTDKIIIDTAKEVEKIVTNKQGYIPYYDNDEFFNIKTEIVNELQKLSNEKLVSDKSIRYGFFLDNNKKEVTLLDKIAYRKEPTVLADQNKYNISDVTDALNHFDRYPIIVCLDKDNSFQQLNEIYYGFSKYIPNELQSILFRIESSDKINVHLNEFVKDKKLNNWVDNKTKIVYIEKTKLPKVLLKSSFKPKTAFSKSSLRPNKLVANYIGFNCDLIIYNDTDLSSFKQTYNKGFNSWQLVNL